MAVLMPVSSYYSYESSDNAAVISSRSFAYNARRLAYFELAPDTPDVVVDCAIAGWKILALAVVSSTAKPGAVTASSLRPLAVELADAVVVVTVPAAVLAAPMVSTGAVVGAVRAIP